MSLKSQYIRVRDASKVVGAVRTVISYYEELSWVLEKDYAVTHHQCVLCICRPNRV